MRAFKLLLAWLSLIGVSSAAGAGLDGAQKAKGGGDDTALALKLEVVERPDGDLRQAKLRLTATNTSKQDIILDTELLVGFQLKFETDIGSKDAFVSEDRDVTPEEVKRWSKPTREAARKRFAKVAPGQSRARDYDLSQPVRAVKEGHATLKDKRHVGFYYEADIRYRLPPRAKKLFIQVSYQGEVWMFAESEFEEWFGVSVAKSGLWQGQTVSNTVTVEKK
jgi:hypothetical protein